MKKSSADGSDTGKLNNLFTERNTVKSKNLVQSLGNSSLAGNTADVANERIFHLPGSMAQSNPATVIRASSAQPLYSHLLDLNTQGQVEANINLTANRPKTTVNWIL